MEMTFVATFLITTGFLLLNAAAQQATLTLQPGASSGAVVKTPAPTKPETTQLPLTAISALQPSPSSATVAATPAQETTGTIQQPFNATSMLQPTLSSAAVGMTETTMPGTTQPPFIATSTLQPTPSSASVVETPIPTMPGTTQPPIECGGMLAGSSGWFASPGFPSQYTNRLNCTWTLQIPAKGVLTLNFPAFHTEWGYDFVDLTDSSGRIIEWFSGSEPIYDIKIGGNTTQLLNVIFLSDYSITDHGFLAQYSITIGTSRFRHAPSSAASDETPTPTMPGTMQPPLIECGGMLTGSSGSFTSPGFPSPYPDNLNCTWTLRIPANGVLTLDFPVFFTEYGYDFITTTDSSGRIIQRLSGSGAVNNIKVGGNTTQLLNIVFTSDNILTYYGFLAQYSITIRSPEARGSFRNISTPAVVCKLNTTCSLFCYLSSDEPVQYNWTKNGQPLTGDDVMIIENVLIVTPRKEDDYGVYVCKAKNSVGCVEYEISLEELPGGSPVPHNISTPSVACKLDTTCSLFCYMASSESVRYKWTRNGKLMTGSVRDVTTMNNVLIVTPRDEEDYGVYVCKATNSAGSAEYEITLKEEAKSLANSDSAKGDDGQEESRNVFIYVIISLSFVVCILAIAVSGCYFCKRQRNGYESENIQAELRAATFCNPTYTSPTDAS